MEFFKTNEMKKEFNDLTHVIIPLLNECGNCGVEKCVYCPNFFVTCNMCRRWRCKNCFTFKSSKEFLMKNCDQHAKDYLANFFNFLRYPKPLLVFLIYLLLTMPLKKKQYFFRQKRIKKTLRFCK